VKSAEGHRDSTVFFFCYVAKGGGRVDSEFKRPEMWAQVRDSHLRSNFFFHDNVPFSSLLEFSRCVMPLLCNDAFV
jgi:hypothetical protein